MNFKKRAQKSDPDFDVVRFSLKHLGIKYAINWTKGKTYYRGYAKPEEGVIVVFGKKAVDITESKNGRWKFTFDYCSKEEILSTILHEIQHILMYRQGLFLNYHSSFIPKKHGYKRFKKWAAEMLPAERLADKRAKRMLNRFFPRAKYAGSYRGKNGARAVNHIITQAAETCFPRNLKEMKKKYPIK